VEPGEQAIRARFRTPTTLRTFGQGKPFVLERIDPKGIVLLLGKQRNYTPLGWDCLENIVPFLRRHPGWVPAVGRCRASGAWRRARDKGPPLRVQLTERFRQ
jgi:hypothetical protein